MTTPAEQLEAKLHEHVGSVVFGASDILHGLAITMIAKGHVLLQGVPGLGKTLLAKTLATQLGGKFKRIQCTADLMPSDITGIHVYDSNDNKFTLMPGPIFADVVLVDEVNRTGPKTQSALLEAMEESTVTIDRNTYPLSDNFFLIASQNPHDFEGTYPLPESQLDRFLVRLDMGYPEAAVEQQVLRAYDRPDGGHKQLQGTMKNIDGAIIEKAQQQVAAVHVSDAVYQYVSGIADASRVHHQISLGLSTRGALALMRCARVEAGLRGAEFVTPDDVKAVAIPVMSHRLIMTPDASLEGVDSADLVLSILSQVAVPRE